MHTRERERGGGGGERESERTRTLMVVCDTLIGGLLNWSGSIIFSSGSNIPPVPGEPSEVTQPAFSQELEKQPEDTV